MARLFRGIGLLIFISQNALLSFADPSPAYCLEQPDSGPCEAATARWFYDPLAKECKGFTYGGCEGNRNNFQDKESCEKACYSECGIQMCAIECPSGFKQDDRGCDMCECNPEDNSECGNQMCMIACPLGFKQDERGCDMCECNPECGNLMCMIECPTGFKQDAQGCDMCECNPECGNQMCMIKCPSGFKQDKQGCNLCECNPEVESECGNQMCMIKCPTGFKQDDRGCNLCECNPEMEVYVDKCADVTCEAPLECKVFELTSSRHQIPRCVDPSKPDACQAPMDAGPCKGFKPRWHFNTDKSVCEEFSYGGCRGNTNNFQDEAACVNTCINKNADSKANKCGLTCMMHCEAGFKKDAQGCDMCECEEVCPQNTVCGLSCRHGYKKDDKGCQLCECRNKPACLKDIECAMECTYGFVVLDDGCQLCECQKEPCADVDCGAEEQCENRLVDEKWTTECVSLHEVKPWCGSEMCAMHCEHGFSTDQYGCNECKCLDQPPACTLEICDVTCPNGMSYDQNGCRTCECLPSPCQLDTCPLTEACEVKARGECTSCPATFACLAPDEVKRVRISLHYFFENPEQYDERSLQDLRKEFHRQLCETLGLDEDILQGLKVEFPEAATIAVSFHLVSFSGNNLVEVYENFKDKVTQHSDHSAVLYDGRNLIPEHATLAAQYHSNMDVPEEDLWHGSDAHEGEDDNMTQTVTIIAAVIGGFVGLAVIIVILVAIIRTKTKHKGQYQKHKNSKNVIYKKAPATEQA